MKRVLFVCSQNLLRSPTAEQVFANYPGIECTSAGLAKDTHNPVTDDLVEWADLIFVMEKVHRRKLAAIFGKHLKNQRVICLDAGRIICEGTPETIVGNADVQRAYLGA